MMVEKTLDYYEKNADSFSDGTVNIDFSDTQKRFAAYIPDGGSILDFGCGAGRDTKAFLDMGYQVDAIDGSEKLCEKAAKLTGIPVRNILFSDLDEKEKYDGIWACASILHLPKDELKMVLHKMFRALKQDGYAYTSFKYGDFEGSRNGRFFTDFTEDSFRSFLSDIEGLVIEKLWITNDVRPGRQYEKWLNVILRTTRR